jgi:hypothetical protein
MPLYIKAFLLHGMRAEKNLLGNWFVPEIELTDNGSLKHR